MSHAKNLTLFFSHALNEGDRTTDLMRQRFRDDVSKGKDWVCGVDSEEVPAFRWLDFKVSPNERMRAAGVTVPSSVHFYALPLTGKSWFARERAAGAPNEFVLRRALRHAIEASEAASYSHRKLGWGAYTKLTTGHGERFLYEGHLSEATGESDVWTTHGDAGTAAMVYESLRLSGVGHGHTLSIVGAYGVIGSALARHAFGLGIKKLVLIGNADKPGKTDKWEKLAALRAEVLALFPERSSDIILSQDIKEAHSAHSPEVVVVSTSGSEFDRSMFPLGSVIFDLTTPRALRKEMGWDGFLVLTAGSAEFTDPSVLPEGFDRSYGWTDVGAGGDYVVWGCFAETIARSVFSFESHVVGTDVKKDDFDWCLEHFPLIGLAPPKPDMFGERIEWEVVRKALGR